MSQANGVNTMPPASSQDSFNSGLANQQAARAEALQRLRKLRKAARDEIDRLLDFLDASDDYVQTELEDAVDDVACDGEGDEEPSLGSFDRMTDQSKSWVSVQGAHIAQSDAEKDDCDAECSDTGIADLDGLYEQTAGRLTTF